MSGIVGSRLNIRGSGLVGSLGSDGQVFTSSGAGTSAVYEAAATGGKILQFATDSDGTAINLGADINNWNNTLCNISFTPVESGSKILVEANPHFYCDGDSNYFSAPHARFSIDGNLTEASTFYGGLGESGDYIDFDVDSQSIRHVYTTTGTSAIDVILQVKATDGGDVRYMHYGGQCVMTIIEVGS
jgi:hypothetical protein